MAESRFENLRGLVTLTTYRAGLLQAKAYRHLQNDFNVFLKPAGITMAEWALLGCLADHKQLKPGQLTEMLDVRAPLISAMLDQIEAKGLIARTIDPTDSRAKIISLSPAGIQLVKKTEKEARNYLLKYLHGVKPSDLVAYIRVVQFLADK